MHYSALPQRRRNTQTFGYCHHHQQRLIAAAATTVNVATHGPHRSATLAGQCIASSATYSNRAKRDLLATVVDRSFLGRYTLFITAQYTLVHMRGFGIACRLSVCLSVCPSVCNVGGL